LHWLQEIATVG